MYGTHSSSQSCSAPTRNMLASSCSQGPRWPRARSASSTLGSVAAAGGDSPPGPSSTPAGSQTVEGPKRWGCAAQARARAASCAPLGWRRVAGRTGGLVGPCCSLELLELLPGWLHSFGGGSNPICWLPRGRSLAGRCGCWPLSCGRPCTRFTSTSALASSLARLRGGLLAGPVGLGVQAPLLGACAELLLQLPEGLPPLPKLVRGGLEHGADVLGEVALETLQCGLPLGLLVRRELDAVQVESCPPARSRGPPALPGRRRG